METPIDIILKHLTDDFAHNCTEQLLATNIDTELQEKFLHFNIAEEIESVEYTTNGGALIAGDGPEQAQARFTENPDWVLRRAVNMMGLYWRLKQEQDAAELRLVRARRPAPGVYEGKAARHFIAVVTEDRRILVQRTDGGFNDSTETYDAMVQDGDRAWKLRRINLTDGTVES